MEFNKFWTTIVVCHECEKRIIRHQLIDNSIGLIALKVDYQSRPPRNEGVAGPLTSYMRPRPLLQVIIIQIVSAFAFALSD